MIKQSKAFLDSEGDQWYERNKSALNTKSTFTDIDSITHTLQNFSQDINQILEIGCSNAKNLKKLCEFFNANGTGIDPSPRAIEEGGSSLNLHVGTASKLPFEANSFDLVLFGFCLYLVDRSEIFQAVAEADRVLKPGRFLAIVDFDPGQRHKRPYHHAAEVFSYKTSHADFFTAGGHYYLIAKESFTHNTSHFSTNSDERISVSVLYKETDAYYTAHDSKSESDV